jgi:hypothetical protein
LLRDYMGAVPPVAPDVRTNDIMIGADGKLTRPQTGGALQSAEVPASAVSSATGDPQS